MQFRSLLLVVALLLGACTGDSDAAADASSSDGTSSTDTAPGASGADSDGIGSGSSSGTSADSPGTGSSSSGSSMGATSTTVPRSTSTTMRSTAPSSTTSTAPRSPSPAPAAPDQCRNPKTPEGQRSEAIIADVDGDGSDDQIFTVQHGENWAVVATFGGGGGSVVDLVGVDPRSFVRVVGGADIMGAGVDDLVVVTGVGASTEQIGFVRLSECDLFELAFDDSSPARFLTGASINNGEALICPGDGTLERIHFSAIPGSDDDGDPEFEAGFEPFRIEGNVVKRLAPDGSESGQGIPNEGVVLTLDDVSAISLFDCLGLEL